MAYIAGTGDDEEEKKRSQNSISGEVDAAAVGGSAMPKLGPQPYTQSSFAGAKQIFDKNKDGAQQYDVSQPFQEDLSKGQEGLKSSFGKLTGSIGQQVQSSKADDNELADAIAKGSQSGSFAKIQAALSPSQIQGKLDPVNTQYSASDVASLNTAPGIQAAIGNQAQKKGVQNYTQGMGALDAAIYQGNSGYRQKVADLSKSYGDYQNQKEDYNKQATSAIEKSNKELADNAEALKGRLSNQAEDVRKSGLQGGSLFQNYANIAKGEAVSKAEKQKQDYIAEATKGMTDFQKNQFMRDMGKVSAANYGRAVGGEGSYDQDSASKFNNIMSLLNRGDRVDVGNTSKADVDAVSLKRDIDKYAANARKVSDAPAQQAGIQPSKEQQYRESVQDSRAKAAAEREKNSYYTKGGQKVYYTPGGIDDPNTANERY